MSVNSLLEAVTSRFRARERQRAETFEGLIVQLADGKAPKADEVEAVLDDAHRSPTELQEAVDRLVCRRAAAKAVAAARGAAGEREKLIDAARRLDAEHDAVVLAATEKRAKALEPLAKRRVQLDEFERAARAGELLLHSTYEPTDEEEAELTRLQAELRAAKRRRSEHEAEAAKERRAADETAAKHIPPGLANNAPRAAAAAKLASHDAAQEAAEKEAAAITPTITALEKRMEEINARQLLP